jgi:DNA-binding Xre family transcriptional regulator
MEKRKVKQIEWRLWALMADRGIRSASELAEIMLKKTGHEISQTHITRYTKDTPPALTLKMIGHILTALDATPQELFRVVEVEIDDEKDKVDEVREEVERRTRIKGDQPPPKNPIASIGPKLFRLTKK